MQFSFLHLADTHLGFHQYGLRERYNDFFHAAHWAMQQAVARQADFVVLAGDLFHKRSNLQPFTLEQAFHLFDVLRKAGIPCLVIEGNHDKPFFLDKRMSWIEFLARRGYARLLNFVPGQDTELRPATPDAPIGHYCEVLPDVFVFGMSYKGAGISAAVADLAPAIVGFEEARKQYAVLALHAGMTGKIPAHLSSALNRADLEPLRSYIDYVAMGHYHNPFDLENWIFNPGSPEITSVDLLDDRNESGAMWVQVDTEAQPRHDATRLLSPKRPWIREKFDVSRAHAPAELREQLRERLQTRYAHLAERQPIVHILLHGRFRFDAIQLNLKESEQEIAAACKALICHIQVTSQAETPASAATSSAQSLQDIEQTAFRERIAAQEPYSQRPEHWLGVVNEVTEFALTKAPAATIYDVLRRADDHRQDAAQEAAA